MQARRAGGCSESMTEKGNGGGRDGWKRTVDGKIWSGGYDGYQA